MKNTEKAHAVFATASRAFALIRQTCADLLQCRDEGTQGIHSAIESEMRPRRQSGASSAIWGREECLNLVPIGLAQPWLGATTETNATPSQ